MGTMPEECTGVEGDTQHTLEDPPRGRHGGASRTEEKWKGTLRLLSGNTVPQELKPTVVE